MQGLKRWLLIVGASILIFAVLLLVLAFIFPNFIVDLWWFNSLDYGPYFWQRLLYKYLVFGFAVLLFFMIFFINFWIASRCLNATSSTDETADIGGLRTYKKLSRRFQESSLNVYFLVSIVLSILIALPLFREWEAALLYIFGASTGVEDPVYGNDISFYLFSLPVYLLLLSELFIVSIILFLGLAVLYWLEHRLLSRYGRHLPRRAKLHLSILVLFLFSIGVWHFYLQRYELLYVDKYTPLFYGPGFVEMQLIWTLIWVAIVLLVAIAFSLIFFIYTHRGWKIPLALTVLFLIVLGARYSPFGPEILQEYIVKPNEFSVQRPFIENNIEATLSAYDLQDVETREYAIEGPPWDTTTPEVQLALRNVPVWDRDVLIDVFAQLQQIRTYYDFHSVDVGRYTIEDVYQQVFLSAREINLEHLPEEAKNWINRRLKYTHGYGAVMTPAAQDGEEPMTWFMQGIPPESDYDVEIEDPSIYYGMLTDTPVIAPNDSGEFGYPVENTNIVVDYKGQGGVRINNLFRKLIFALYFRERNIFFTTQTNSNSRILFRRNIIDRINALTPFFILDKDPYLVITPERMYWIQDAYTYSSWYPYSQPYRDQFNYVRNSVKIVVDAYHGTVNYYIADPRDPIIRTYSRIYPGLFKNLDEIPSSLRPHVRYPKDIFDVQMSVYNKYHQTDPDIFYKQEDLWVFPQFQRENETRVVTSYYLTLNLIDRDKFEFILFTPMTPKGRDNLRALAVVGSDGDNYGRIVVYNFPKGLLVYGPAQIDALINQDAEIAEQFTLWGQVGSEVERGNKILMPIDGVIVYIQPVYLKAVGRTRIPQLTRLIVAQGEFVVMRASLEEGFEVLNERVAADQRRRSLQRLETPTEAPDLLEEPVEEIPQPLDLE